MITPLDQQIAGVLIANPKNKEGIIQGLISLLREQDQTIANLEDHNTTLRDCLRTRNELIAQYEQRFTELDAELH